MKPNIFNWATSELSQDAFICWLLSWANRKESKELFETSRLLINKLTNGAITNFENVEIHKQYHNIDIVCEIDKTKVILIEDKVHTDHHSNQLERYYSILQKQYSKENIYPVFFKTGDQSNFITIKNIGYQIFLRNDFLEVLNYGINLGIKNDIFIDFYQYLTDIENSVQSYLSLPVNEWHWDSWKGFYKALQQELEDDCDWGYVPQKNGGFLGFWWYWCSKKTNENLKYEYYLQLEHNKFCFKMSPENRKDAETTRSHFRNLLYLKAKEYNIDIYQNGRIGKWMTVAALSEPYIKTDAYGFLDLKSTIENIKRIQEMIDEI